MSNAAQSLDLKIKCQDDDEMKQRFIKCILGSSNVSLTDKEFDILFALAKHCKGILNTETRKQVCKLLEISIGNLNNNIARMSEKGVFVELNDKTTIYPVFMVDLQKLGFLKLSFTYDK